MEVTVNDKGKAAQHRFPDKESVHHVEIKDFCS
jgi:hypothetical protein